MMKNLKNHYKYVHIFWHDETKFSKSLVNFFYSHKKDFNPEEHLFITTYKSVFEKLPQHENVIYMEFENPVSAEVINTVGKLGDWIFCHNICGSLEFLKIKPKYIKKIIWRSWGGNRLSGIPCGSNRIKNIAFRIINKEISRRANSFKAIGIANLIDQIELSKNLKNKNMFIMPYATSGCGVISYEKYEKESKKKKGNTYNIMVGHSGYTDDRHIELLNQLLRFKNYGIKPYIVLSYGNNEYIERVKSHILKTWGNQAEIIDEFMDYPDYIKLLSIMDAGIFPAQYSYALGNIAILLTMNKKLFFDDKGIIAEAFRTKGTPYGSIDTLSTIKYDEFTSPVNYSEEDYKTFGVSSDASRVENWKKIIKFLNS